MKSTESDCLIILFSHSVGCKRAYKYKNIALMRKKGSYK